MNLYHSFNLVADLTDNTGGIVLGLVWRPWCRDKEMEPDFS